MRGRLDSVSLAGIAVFSALATLLAAVSQSLGLNFPVVPYLQFDLGEVAIIMAFFIFGPLPAVASSVVEFVALMAFGQNVPVGPILKLVALVSTVGGMWVGSRLASRLKSLSVARVVTLSLVTGAVVRAAAMTIPNYYIVVYLYGLQAIEGLLKGAFGLVGIAVGGADTLTWILGFTAVFNVLQLAFVVALSYAVLRVPPVSNLRVGGRAPWFVAVTTAKPKAEGARQ